MAIKSSNQITFVEHKKILEVKEWYLATNLSTGVTRQTAGWTSSVQTIDVNKQYLWNYEEIVYSIGNPDLSDPVIIGHYGVGVDGTSQYFHVKYSDNGTSFTSNNGTTIGAWIGTCVTSSSTAPMTFNTYSWQKVKGEDGAAGKDGATYYTWIKYADDDSGKNMSDDPTGKEYIGIAYNKTTSTESTVASDYTWSLFKGTDGINGINGKDGKGISSVVNYYQVSTTTTAPSTSTTWPTTAPMLTSTNKYLWNYEVITYTDTTKTTTTPAIIGVYGDPGAAGADAITFEIYSTQGFLFKEDMSAIDLKLAAFKGSSAISGATYSWSYYNPETSAYVAISAATNVTTTSLTINLSDVYAMSTLQCVMTYGGKTYTRYVTLGRDVTVYTANIRFLDGRNVFTSVEPYVVAYVNLYRNNALIETIAADSYYVDTSMTISGTTITTTAPKIDGTRMYFIYKVSGTYKIVLGECKSSVWSTVTPTVNHTYYNNLVKDTTSNIILIPKDGISRTKELVFTVNKGDNMVSTSSATIVDLNDPVVAPSWTGTKYDGQLWYDTSENTLKVWSSSKSSWVQSKQQGGSVYTSRPTSYYAGDLWIVENNNIISGVVEGTMLKSTSTSSTFNSAHWIDAASNNTKFLSDAKQYLKFDPNTGLKIGQANDKFYVNIESAKMGFHSVEYDTNGTVKRDAEVVQIGNDSSTIRNATFEGGSGTTFNNNATFKQQVKIGPFVWTVEGNNSLSLAIDS